MRRRALLALIVAVAPAVAQPREPLVEQVKRGIKDGVNYLRRIEGGNGSWDKDAVQTFVPGGQTTLAMLALVTAGVPLDDPMIERGMATVRAFHPDQTYVVGLQTMLYAEVNDPKDLGRVQRNVDWLISNRRMTGQRLEGWGYGAGHGGTNTDASNSQYALLGLYAGQRAGAKIDPVVWQQIREHYVAGQQPDGSWIYNGSQGPSLSMTVAGLCGLHISGLETHTGKQGLQANGVAINCGQYAETPAIVQGLRWIAQGGLRGGGPRFNFESQKNSYYNTYGIERLGRLSGQRFIAGHDWYREGCEWLLSRQRDDGSWQDNTGKLGSGPSVCTCFALMFLAKGRTPILLSKLAYGQGEGWNNKHSDAKNLVELASVELFKRQPLAWQVYDSRRLDLRNRDDLLAEAGTLLQAPILYFNGHESPRLTEQQKLLLKQYLDEGGFVFAEACCGSTAFANGFRALMTELYPDHAPKPLPAEHAVWTSFAAVPPGSFALEGVDIGCKTVAVLAPEPMAGFWEENQQKSPRSHLAFRTGLNVIAYATGMEMPKPRLTEVKVNDTSEAGRVPRGYLKAAQLRHDGDWQPAPRAVRNLMLHLRTEYRIDVALAPEELRFGSPDLFQFKFLYLHGRGRFNFTDDDVTNLRANLQEGGTLLSDACCGSPPFDAAFRTLAAKLFPDAKLEPIPTTDELYSDAISGQAIRTVRLRREPGQDYANSTPQLEGIKVDGRWAVIYSKFDLGCALEKQKASDCRGYDHPSALKLGSSAVLYSLKR